MDSSKKGFESITTIDLSDSLNDLLVTDNSMNTLSVTGGAAGSPYVINTLGTNPSWTVGSNGSNWSDITYGTTIRPSGTIELKGEDADIKINDKSLMKTLETIEQRLGMLEPNPEMEKEWDELRELAERYRALEQQCIEKSEMWKKLKSMPPPEIK